MNNNLEDLKKQYKLLEKQCLDENGKYLESVKKAMESVDTQIVDKLNTKVRQLKSEIEILEREEKARQKDLAYSAFNSFIAEYVLDKFVALYSSMGEDIPEKLITRIKWFNFFTKLDISQGGCSIHADFKNGAPVLHIENGYNTDYPRHIEVFIDKSSPFNKLYAMECGCKIKDFDLFDYLNIDFEELFYELAQVKDF